MEFKLGDVVLLSDDDGFHEVTGFITDQKRLWISNAIYEREVSFERVKKQYREIDTNEGSHQPVQYEAGEEG